MKMSPNAQINVASAGSLAVRAAALARRQMYSAFIASVKPRDAETILDVGATSDREYEASNYLEAWFPQKERITAVGLDNAAFLETAYPGLRFVRADGCKLPFGDRAFDVVHSSAVLEHVGSRSQQRAFLNELARVAKRAVFVTTPNRWYPIEFHTLLPLVHWLPRPAFYRVLRMAGRGSFADETVLNLLTPTEMREMASAIRGFGYQLQRAWFCGWPSNLLLTMTRV